MSTICRIFDSFRHTNLVDEDGNVLPFTRKPALPQTQLTVFEQAECVRLPREFRDLLMYANGMSLFGLELMPTDQQTRFAEYGIISFQLSLYLTPAAKSGIC